MDWRQEARDRQQTKRREFFLSVIGLYALWFGLSGLGWFAWIKIFHAEPSPRLILSVFVALGGCLVAIFVKYGPALPFQGKAPEEAAAEAFLSGKDVRYDDDTYEADLKP